MAQNFVAPKAYTPGGNDLVNTLQNEDVLTGNVAAGATTLTADIGNHNDSGSHIIAPSITNVDTINVAFTNTDGYYYYPSIPDIATGMALDFQDITGTETANITRISASLRNAFFNLKSEVSTLGISNTSEQAKVTINYLNNQLSAANNAVTLNLNNASLSGSQADFDFSGGGAALQIEASQALGSDLQHQIETYNINTVGSASTIATFETGVSSFDDLVVGERPQAININAGASLAIGTMRWLGNRVETNSANNFQVVNSHIVGTNGLGFVDFDQINQINVTGSSNVTLANVGTWETEVDADDAIDFTLNASTLTGRLTADITNSAGSIDSSFTGGQAGDRFYIAGGDGNSQLPAIALAAVSGGAGNDSLTVQSSDGAIVDLFTGSVGMETLNLVQGASTIEDASWEIDLTDGGFNTVTFNNQSATATMSNVLTGFNAAQQSLSIRSTGLNGVGDPATTAQGAVAIQFLQALGVVGGTMNLELGHASDDRSSIDAFSHKNYTSTVSLVDNGVQATTEVASLNLVLNTAGALGTGAAQINVVNDDFETLTTLTSQVAATNVANIGWQQAAGGSNYAAGGTNALNSTTYNGSAYLGTQNVTFGSALANQAVAKSHVISTGTANDDTVDLSYMGTSTDRTPVGAAISSYLLGTSVNLSGGTGDELILSASLADPRVVLNADITYDGYFQNWSNVDTLTINNRNNLGVSLGTNSQALTNAYVGLDAYAQTNNSGLNVINFNDVSGEVAVGFRFTNALTINADATGAGTLERATKWTTVNSFSSANNTVNVDASAGIATGVGNLVQYTNSGANLSNTVTLNYNMIDNSGVSITATELLVQNNGSVDYVDFNGDLGLDPTAATGNITVTTDQTWTAALQATTYDFRDVVNSSGGVVPANAVITFSAAAETNATGLTIYGSTDGGSATLGVSNAITGSSGADLITSAGYSDSINGGAGNDTITYTGNSAALSVNAVAITGGTGLDTISVNSMAALELASINAGAGNDVVSMGLESDSYIFADVAVVLIDPVATVAQVVLNVGTDTITNYNVAADIFNLDLTVFGTGIGAAGTIAATSYSQVTNGDALVGGLTTGGIVVVQAAANANVSIYYVDTAVTTGTQSINNLVQAGDATLIGSVSNVVGLFTSAEFLVVA